MMPIWSKLLKMWSWQKLQISLGYDTEEIPDEVLLEMSWKQDTCSKDDS